MRSRSGQIGLVILSFALLVTSLTSSSEAGLVPWVWDALFGPVYRPYNTCYGPCSPGSVCGSSCDSSPCGPGGCSTVSAFPSAYAVSYAFAPCSSCGSSCSPGVSCGPGGCPGGACGMPASSPGPGTSSSYSVPVPVEEDSPLPPESNWQRSESKNRTFADPAEPMTPSTDPGFSDPLRGNTPAPESEPEKVDSFRPIFPDSKEPAPTKIEEDDSSKPEAESKTNGSADPFQNKLPIDQPQNLNKESDTRLPIPVLNVNPKIAWKVVPKRERVKLRANYRTPVIARHKSDLKNEWMPVTSETHVAGK